MNRALTAAVLAASMFIAAAPAQAEADTRQITVADYTVFVDPPTRFVFVKLPSGWKFAGKVEATDMTRLPGTVVTALLKPDADMAAAAMQSAAR